MIKRTFADIPIFDFDVIDSTNKYCLDNIKSLENEFSRSNSWLKAVVTAQFQTDGKGRRDRQWQSEPSSALLSSFIIYPKFFGTMLDTTLIITTINMILQEYSVPASIKWPNDIIIENGENEKNNKICGVLTQIIDEYLIIGIGLNVVRDDKSTLENISYLDDFKINKSPKSLLEEIITRVCGFNDDTFIPKNILDQYRNASSTITKKVRIETIRDKFEGTAKGISQSGSIIIELEDKSLIELSEGDIIHIR